MKRFKVFLTMLVAIFFIGGCNGSKDDNKDDLKVSYENFKKTEKDYSYDIKIPQISGAENEDISYFNVTMQELSRNLIDNMYIPEDGEDGEFSEANIATEEHKNNFDVLSMVLYIYVYNTGAAHGTVTPETYNFNKHDNSLISFENIFTSKDVEFFNNEINKQIRDGKKVKNINGEDGFLYDDAEANINDAVFYFDGDNLVFIFQSYSLAPYSSGMPMFKIPKDVAMKHIHLK